MFDPSTILANLMQYGWQVERRRLHGDLLPEDVRKRYPLLPVDLELFLGAIDSCMNGNRTVWFLTPDDYRRNRVGQFRWNEHELMCLEAAEGDNDEVGRIRAYWDTRFPFMFAVHSDYDYLAIDLSPDLFGQVVHGYMPEPQESSTVAISFAQFSEMFISAIMGKPTYPLSVFV